MGISKSNLGLVADQLGTLHFSFHWPSCKPILVPCLPGRGRPYQWLPSLCSQTSSYNHKTLGPSIPKATSKPHGSSPSKTTSPSLLHPIQQKMLALAHMAVHAGSSIFALIASTHTQSPAALTRQSAVNDCTPGSESLNVHSPSIIEFLRSPHNYYIPLRSSS